MPQRNTSGESHDQGLIAADLDSADKQKNKHIVGSDAEEHTARDDDQEEEERRVSKKRKRGSRRRVIDDDEEDGKEDEEDEEEYEEKEDDEDDANASKKSKAKRAKKEKKEKKQVQKANTTKASPEDELDDDDFNYSNKEDARGHQQDLEEERRESQHRNKRSHSESTGRSEEEKKQERDRCKKFIEAMIQAFNADKKAIKEGQPGLNKLRMLSNVSKELMNKAHQSDFVVVGICDVLAEWLAPVKTVLPNLSLRVTLLNICNDLPVSANTIGIEKLMTMMKVYTLHPDETKENKKLARGIMRKWVQRAAREERER